MSLGPSPPAYTTRRIHLRVRPCPKNLSKRIITTVLENQQEEENLAAQTLWDEEQRAQQGLGVEKFSVHTYLMPPLNESSSNQEKILLVEFVDSGRMFSYNFNSGVTRWCFKPSLGGVDYTESGGNFYGFKPHSHSFFSDILVPISVRTYRNLQALLVLCKSEDICAGELHDHYHIKILLEPILGQGGCVRKKVACTDHTVCGSTDVRFIFESLSAAQIGAKFILMEVSSEGLLLQDTSFSYSDVYWSRCKVKDMKWSSGYTIFLSTNKEALQPMIPYL